MHGVGVPVPQARELLSRVESVEANLAPDEVLDEAGMW